jgi:hypothetical protein
VPKLDKPELAGAIGYALSRWTALTRYCDDGRIEIDNNAAERALRAVTKLTCARCSRASQSIGSIIEELLPWNVAAAPAVAIKCH